MAAAVFYPEWRLENGPEAAVQDAGDWPAESLLQAAWQHQRLLRDQLVTIDGRAVRVLHPGFQSVSGGPDFRGAVVQIGEDQAVVGDIEVDVRASGWRAHGHDRNPAFKGVIVHVVWEAQERTGEGPPATVCLAGKLDAPLKELGLWLGSEGTPAFPAEFQGKCARVLGGWGGGELGELLRQAGRVRLEGKAAQFRAQARQAGWEQALWEGMFRGLGYRHNAWPMQRLGELRERWWTGPGGQGSGDAVCFQARLLGLAGLLPVDPGGKGRSAEGRYLRRLWDHWWRERECLADVVLPRELWRLAGVRPVNHPQRRLALVSHWAAAGGKGPGGRLEEWCAREVAEGKLVESLWEALRVPADGFWDWHWTLGGRSLNRRQPLLGACRVTDLAMNVVLPWLWARAVEGNNDRVRQRIEQRYETWPRGEDNAVLRQARTRMLGEAWRRLKGGAAHQQGLMQIVRDFCDRSDATCAGCRLVGCLQPG